MMAFRWSLLLLTVAALLLGGCPGSSSHSLRYYYTSVSEPGQSLPRFVAVGYVDDQLFVHYDSHSSTRRVEPRAQWMQELQKEDTRYLDRNTQSFRFAELWSRDALDALRDPGLRVWQLRYGCEVSQDGHKGVFWQYGYDGRDFLSLDNETLTWTAASEDAQRTKRRWEAERRNAPVYKAYLEGSCVAWLWKHLAYGKETLLRKEPPVGKVTHVAKATNDVMETLVCQAHGFYPKEIDATWRKDEEILDHVTFRRDVTPNSDGTYHTWLSVEINPKERDHYRCHVDHAALREPLVLAWEEPGATVGAISVAVAVVLLVAGIIFLLSKKTLEAFETWREKRGYKAVSGKGLLSVSDI